MIYETHQTYTHTHNEISLAFFTENKILVHCE